MIKHVLCTKLKDNSLEECQKLKEMFLSMKDEIDFIRDIQVGIDFLKSERSYDVVLEVIFDSREDLDRYQVFPYHKDVIKPYVAARRTASVTVDYDIE